MITMIDAQHLSYSGWAVVAECCGDHERARAGFVTTEQHGDSVVFRIVVPDLPEEVIQLSAPQRINGVYRERGTKVVIRRMPGYTRLIGAAAIHTIAPCSRDEAMEWLDAREPCVFTVLDAQP